MPDDTIPTRSAFERSRTSRISCASPNIPDPDPDLAIFIPEGLHPDAEELFLLSQQVRDLHEKVWDSLSWSSRQMKSGVYSNVELTDLGFMCRELENLLDDWRKDCKARKELAGKLIARAVLQASENVNDLQATTTVHGVLASATPDVSFIAEIPKPGTPEFIEFCNYFGIDEKASSDPMFPFAIHWKRAQEVLEQRQTAGLPTPPGLGKQFPNFWAKFVRKRSKSAGAAE